MRRKKCSVTLLEIRHRILPTLDAVLAGFALEHFRKSGVEVLLQTSSTQLDAESLPARKSCVP